MLATFSLRLALGMIATLLILPPSQINPRFYRTHFLTAFGLVGVALLFGRSSWGVWLTATLVASMVFAFLGSVSWALDRAPGGLTLIVLTSIPLGIALGLLDVNSPQPLSPGWALTDQLTSAALLGAAMTAMLMGHSYLIAPSMSIVPLQRLIVALIITTLLRMGVSAVGLWWWTEERSLFNLNDVTAFWLPVRWGIGFVGPLVLGVLAWQTTRIRSTQSATGILYVVVIFCFLGELTSLLLLGDSGCTI